MSHAAFAWPRSRRGLRLRLQNPVVLPAALFAAWPLALSAPAIILGSIIGKRKISINLAAVALGVAFSFLVSFKRAYYAEGTASLFVQLVVYLAVLILAHGERIDRAASLFSLKLVVLAHLAISVVYYTTGTPILLFRDLFSVEQWDLIRFGSFRNPGTFNEPSTYCYVVIMLLYFARPSAFWRILTYVSVVSSTALGGILLLGLTLVQFERIKVVIVGYSLVATFILFALSSNIIPEYFLFRMDLILSGEDQSLLLRTGALPSNIDDVILLGYSVRQLHILTDLYAIKGNGFFLFGFLTLGGVGILLLFGIMISVGNLSYFRVVFLIFSKFDLLSPLNLLVLVGKRETD